MRVSDTQPTLQGAGGRRDRYGRKFPAPIELEGVDDEPSCESGGRAPAVAAPRSYRCRFAGRFARGRGHRGRGRHGGDRLRLLSDEAEHRPRTWSRCLGAVTRRPRRADTALLRVAGNGARVALLPAGVSELGGAALPRQREMQRLRPPQGSDCTDPHSHVTASHTVERRHDRSQRNAPWIAQAPSEHRQTQMRCPGLSSDLEGIARRGTPTLYHRVRPTVKPRPVSRLRHSPPRHLTQS